MLASAATLLMYTHLLQDITFQQHLMATRRSLLAAVEHSDVPFTKLVELADVTPSQSHTPIFQSVVSFKEYSAIARESSDQGVSFNPFMIEVTFSFFAQQFC